MRRFHTYAATALIILAGCAGPGLFAGEPMGKQLERVLAEIKKDCIERRAPPFGENRPGRFETSCLMFTLKPWEPGDTPESAFAHSIKLPPPHDKPKDVYKSNMSSEEYFKALCETEAGEWVFRRVEGVKQIRFERPFRTFPSGYQSIVYYTGEPSELAYREPEDYFVKEPLGKYAYLAYRVNVNTLSQGSRLLYRVVERSALADTSSSATNSTSYQVSETSEPRGEHGVVWRGIKRTAAFAEHAIEGHEVIVFEIASSRVLAFRRVFFQFFQESSGPRQDPRFAYARACQQKFPNIGPQAFIESVLIPSTSK